MCNNWLSYNTGSNNVLQFKDACLVDFASRELVLAIRLFIFLGSSTSWSSYSSCKKISCPVAQVLASDTILKCLSLILYLARQCWTIRLFHFGAI